LESLAEFTFLGRLFIVYMAAQYLLLLQFIPFAIRDGFSGPGEDSISAYCASLSPSNFASPNPPGNEDESTYLSREKQTIKRTTAAGLRRSFCIWTWSQLLVIACSRFEMEAPRDRLAFGGHGSAGLSLCGGWTPGRQKALVEIVKYGGVIRKATVK
jgi:hypothetical protein